jgi:hypothetical protein
MTRSRSPGIGISFRSSPIRKRCRTARRPTSASAGSASCLRQTPRNSPSRLAVPVISYFVFPCWLYAPNSLIIFSATRNAFA